MAYDDGMNGHGDEVVFLARYSAFKVWFAVLVVFTFPLWLLFRVCYVDLLGGRYIEALSFSVLPLLGLLFLLDAIFFKQLLFYQDRVVKVWYLFGHRTIYYRSAKVVDPPRNLRWLWNYHHIRETRPGKAFVIQIPIMFVDSFLPSESAEIIEKIVDYLTEDTENTPRTFKKSTLPKEVTCRSFACLPPR